MKTKVIGLIVSVGLASCALYACSQANPPPPCNVGHGDYAAKYLIQTKSGNDACDSLVGEAISIDKFYKLDGGVSDVAMQPEAATAGEPSPASTSGNLYSIGQMQSEEPADNFCTVTGLTKIDAQVPHEGFELLEDGGLPDDAIDAGVGFDAGIVVDGFLETTPAAPFSYEFSDTKFFVVNSAPSAQQFTSTLTYTDTTAGCTATYKVVGMYPAVPCESDVDCDPNADYDAGRLFGSGINEHFVTFCDDKSGYCQLKADDIGEGTLK